MTARACVILLALPAWGHVVSMSSGDLTIEGSRARYELRMPLYEVQHVARPETALLDHIRFSSSGRDAINVSRNCAAEAARDLYLCTAEYEFPAPPELVDVECRFTAVTVPNHVHLLNARRGEHRDQGIFDRSFTRSTLRFRPPTATEIALREFGAGVMRAFGGAVQLLFLAALVLAARSRRELIALTAMFLGGEVLSVAVAPLVSWQPAPRFVEAAMALTVAYFAVEILLLPKAGSRWIVAGVLGMFHGLYFHLFVQTSGYRPAWVMAGAAIAGVAGIAVIALLFARLERLTRALRPVQVCASGLLVFGIAWFLLRFRG